MLKSIDNINRLFVSKILLKLVTISLACFILFNTMFLSVIENVNLQDLSKISSIQKDVFSTIFFVSNSIEKFNSLLTTKFVQIDNKNKQVPQQQDREVPSKYNVFIINNNQSNKCELKLNNVLSVAVLFMNHKLYNIFDDFYNHHLFIYYDYVYILMTMLFFISLNKLYDYNGMTINISSIKSTIIL